MGNLVGQQIEHYQVEALLGEGGMGSVYQARDLNLARPVAIKVIQAHLARQPDFQDRFLQEAQATARLDHPGIIKVFDFRSHDDLLYIVMEYVSGGNLAVHLRRLQWKGALMGLDQALRLVAEVADALDYAHQHGVIHRDVKPGNILLKANGAPANPLHAVLTDFGLAILRDQKNEGIISALPYMSPEQCLAQPVDGRSDLYGLGVVLYQLVTGRLPFTPNNLAEAIQQHGEQSPPDPAELNPDLPAELLAIVNKALAKQPESRYQNGADFARAIRQVLGVSAAASAREAVVVLPVEEVQDWQTRAESLDQITILNAGLQNQFPTDRDLVTVSEAAPRTHTLDEEILTIGRSPENDIVLPHDSISLQHASLTRTPTGSWQVIDLESKNGVYMDGTPLLPHVAEEWYPNQILRIGPYFLQLRSAGSAISVNTGQADIHVLITPAKVDILPGTSAEIQIMLVNGAKERRYIQVSIEDLPASWFSLAQDALRLMPGERGTLNMRVHPPAGSRTRSGEYRFQVIARTISGADIEVAVSGILIVKSVENYLFEISPHNFQKDGVCQVRITNRGNSDTAYAITGFNQAELVRFGVEEVELIEDYEEVLPAGPEKSGPSAADRLKGAGGTANSLMRLAYMIPPLRRIPAVRTAYQSQLRARRYSSMGKQVARTAGKQAAGRPPAQKQTGRPGSAPTGPRLRRTGRIRSMTQLETYMVVPAGRTETLDIEIEPNHRPLTGRGTTYDFTIEASPTLTGDLQTEKAQLQVSPAVPFWISSGIMVIFLLLCLAGAALAVSRIYQPSVADADRDELVDEDELQVYFTDPENSDTDADGLLDGEEVALHLNPRLPDTDGDGLVDSLEIEIGTDPLVVDSDGDTLPDGIEVNELETNPLRSDSDGNNISDRQELALNSDINVWERLLAPTTPPEATPTSLPTAMPTSTPTTRVLILQSNGNLDGAIAEAETNNVGGDALSQDPIIQVGEEGQTQRQFKGLVSFNTGQVPAGADIQQVQLRLQRLNATGSPYARLGQIHVDIGPHLGFNNNIALEAGDFEAPGLVTNAIILTNAENNNEWAEGFLAARNYSILNRDGETQFRFYFTLTDDRNEEDALIWFSSGNDPNINVHPQLIITYLIIEETAQ